MKIKKVYIEITNVCNLSCDFCHGTTREPLFMSAAEFESAVLQVKPMTDYIYLHILGEPLLHPEFDLLLSVCDRHKMKTTITTNGTLIKECEEKLTKHPSLIQLNYSLHCNSEQEYYLDNILNFTRANKAVTHVLRFWNTADIRLIDEISRFYGVSVEIQKISLGNGPKIAENVYIQQMDAFTWPDINGREIFTSGKCLGLKNNIGILADGTVVPCCLDADGIINLGNIFNGGLTEILNGERAARIRSGFQHNIVCEKLCRTCGFAVRLNKYIDTGSE